MNDERVLTTEQADEAWMSAFIDYCTALDATAKAAAWAEMGRLEEAYPAILPTPEELQAARTRDAMQKWDAAWAVEA